MYYYKARHGATNSTLRSEARINADEDLDVNNLTHRIEQETASMAHGKKVWGFPINQSFVTMDQIWEEVKSTKLHKLQDKDAEFSVSVYVHPYPSNVLSVWLYVAAFTRQAS